MTQSRGQRLAVAMIARGLTQLSVLAARFKGVTPGNVHHLSWSNPRGQRLSGVRAIDLFGVWPGQTGVVNVEAGLT